MDLLLQYWPIIAFVLGLVGALVWTFGAYYHRNQQNAMARAEQDGSEAHARIIGMVDDLEGRMSSHEKRTEKRIENVDRKRREGDHELAQDMLALRQRMHDRFVTEKQFGEGMKRFTDMTDRVSAIEKKIDDLPKRIADVIRDE